MGVGAFICTLSEVDWYKTRSLGIYGNRFYKEGTSQKLGNVQQLSIIRDLISMREGDLVFFHIRGKQTIHGVYQVRRRAYYDDKSKIWDNPLEIFPYRFLFEPHPEYTYLTEYDANIEIRSLYEYIDQGKIKSLVTLENEQNIEARGVRKILSEDANILISLLHRDFKYRKTNLKLNFTSYNPSPDIVLLKDCVYKVGSIENAIKAVIMYELANNSAFLERIFAGLELDFEKIDFVNEFFIAQTTRKSIDIYVKSKDTHILIEVKNDKVDESTLRQALYYRDLLSQRPWINTKKTEIKITLIGKRFSDTLLTSVEKLSKINNNIQLIQYKPINNGRWGEFSNVY